MRKIRDTLFLLTLAISQAAGAASWPPPSGGDVDQERTFTLPTRAPEPCLSATLDGVSFLLPTDELKRLAAADKGARNGEADGQTSANAERARRILSLKTAKKKNQFGCAALAKPLAPDLLYVVLNLLEAGKAAVAIPETGELSPQVIVRYLGERCGGRCGHGDIFVYLPEKRRLIMTLMWWIA